MKKLFLLLVCTLLAGVASAAERPNIVFIITDDQSFDSLGFMGGKVHTPRLDQMAEDGLWLTDFNVTSTVCSPSRYSFLTGRYAGRCEGERFIRKRSSAKSKTAGNFPPSRGILRWIVPT